MSVVCEVSWRTERTMQESAKLPLPEGERNVVHNNTLSSIKGYKIVVQKNVWCVTNTATHF